MFKFTLLLLIGLWCTSSIAQNKQLQIERAATSPKIDAVLNDACWQNAEEAKDFIQFRPTQGAPEKPHQKSVVKITYDDNAIYFAAHLYDNPDAIHKQFRSRDDFGASDFFGVVINPNNDAQNDVEFFVFSSGNQADAIANPSIGEDFGWNAVWESAVKIVDDGWIVEIRIPYAALRFSNNKVQTWGIQFHRRFREDNSQYAWSPIDITKGNIGLYHGVINGIENIKPPTRLSFYPFASGLVRSFDGETDSDYNFGMDVKYGISENFTLDATLIPDFSQVGFDDVELNLGPFEQQFSEQRQFFTEGVDLFSKGNLFYSRRIGSQPVGARSAADNLGPNEELIRNPNQVKTLNALKLSGRTKNGLGIGFFNAVTEKTSAIIRNTATNETRKITTEPLANYNILVVDQQFNKNSSVSLINTNVTRNGGFRDANVTGLLVNLVNKSNTLELGAFGKYSNLNVATGNIDGFSTGLSLSKISGKWRYGISHELVSENFNINDFGIQQRTNYSNYEAGLYYQIFEPVGNYQQFNTGFELELNTLYKPGSYTGNQVGWEFYAQNKKLLSFGGSLAMKIGTQYDYFEARTPGRYFTYKNEASASGYFSSNDNKTFSLQGNGGMFYQFDSARDLLGYWIQLEPTLKLGDKFRLTFSSKYQDFNGSRGYVTNLNNDIVFGERNTLTVENGLIGGYNFNPYHELSLTFRNYHSTVQYDQTLFNLEQDGSLSPSYDITDISNPNFNFKTWNLDFKYAWQFAPGSLVSVLYRNSLFNQSSAASENYFDGIGTLFDNPMEHIFSVRVVYYIDYNKIKRVFK